MNNNKKKIYYTSVIKKFMPAYVKLVKKTFCLDDPRKRKNVFTKRSYRNKDSWGCVGGTKHV